MSIRRINPDNMHDTHYLRSSSMSIVFCCPVAGSMKADQPLHLNKPYRADILAMLSFILPGHLYQYDIPQKDVAIPTLQIEVDEESEGGLRLRSLLGGGGCVEKLRFCNCTDVTRHISSHTVTPSRVPTDHQAPVHRQRP